MKISYHFVAKPFRHAEAGWYFLALPFELSQEIRTNFKSEEEGWGRLKASAKIGDTEWQTAVWFDTKRKCYLLPIKAEVRKKEMLDMQKDIAVVVMI